MDFAIAFVAGPVLAYLGLACLPQGRPALLGVLAAATLAAVLWVTQMASENTYAVEVIALSMSAIALAAFVQVLRAAIGAGRAAWVYTAIVGLALAAAALAMRYEFGH